MQISFVGYTTCHLLCLVHYMPFSCKDTQAFLLWSLLVSNKEIDCGILSISYIPCDKKARLAKKLFVINFCYHST